MSNYAFEGPKWSSNAVTWSFADKTYIQDAATPFSSTIGLSYRLTIAKAIGAWARASGVALTRVADSSSVNIRVGFGLLDTPSTYTIGYTSYHWTYGGTGQVFTPDTVVRLEDPKQLPLILNATGGYTYQGFSTTLYQTALHELGHALGLGHSTDVHAVMNPNLDLSNPTLNASDRAGIQALYLTTASATVTSTTTAGTGAPISMQSSGVSNSSAAEGDALRQSDAQNDTIADTLLGTNMHDVGPGFLMPNIDSGAVDAVAGTDTGEETPKLWTEGAMEPTFVWPTTGASAEQHFTDLSPGIGAALPVDQQAPRNWFDVSFNQGYGGAESLR